MLEKLQTASYSFVISILLVSCMTYEDVEITRVVSTDIKKFSAKGIEVAVALQIKNPNNYKISITEADLNVFLNNNEIGKAVIKENIVIPKNSNDVHNFTITLKNADLKASAMGTMLGAALGGSMRLTVKGYIKAKAKMISKKVPVEFTENL